MDDNVKNTNMALPTAMSSMQNTMNMLQYSQQTLYPPLPGYSTSDTNNQTGMSYYGFPYQPNIVDPKYSNNNNNSETGGSSSYNSNYSNNTNYPNSNNYFNTNTYPNSYSYCSTNSYFSSDTYNKNDNFIKNNEVPKNDTGFKAKKKIKRTISKLLYCQLCKIRCNSQEQFDVHRTSKKHTRNQKRFLSGEKPVETKPIFESLSCNICQLFNISNITEYNEHMMSSEHREKLVLALDTVSSKFESGTENSTNEKELEHFGKSVAETEEKGTFQCKICMVVCNSAVSYNCHINSKKHKLNSFSSNVYSASKLNDNFNQG